jgi:AcrR family transcriptional regulator
MHTIDNDTSRAINPEREARILDAAAQLIMHFGYDKTTVSDIARQAGVSKGAVYLHWDSKDALFEALLWREIYQYADQWLKEFEAEPGDWSFATMFKAMLLTLHDNPFMLAMMRRDSNILGSFLRRDSSLLEFKFVAGDDFFKVMQAAGAIRDDIKPEVLAYISSMLAYGLISMGDVMSLEAMPPLDETLDGIAKMLDRALVLEDANQEAGKAVIKQVMEAMRQQFPTGGSPPV